MKILMASLFVMMLQLAAMPAQAGLAIIAHPDNTLVGISKDDIRDIYMGKSKSFPGGGSVVAVDQEAGSAAREKFNSDVLQMNDRKRKAYWSRLIFTGKGKPPRTMDNDEDIRDWVASEPKGLGYIDGSKLNDKVKVLLILP